MKTVVIEAQIREQIGKKENRRLRSEGRVPGVIYGGEEVIHFSVDASDLRDLVFTPEFQKAKVKIDGKELDALVKDLQFHPVNDELIHIDFIQLVEGQEVKATIPLKLEGMAAGVKEGGKLQQLVRGLKVSALPSALVDIIRLDVSSLKLGKVLRVSDIELQEGITILNTPAIPVATVEIPRSMRSAMTRAEAKAAGVALEDANLVGEDGEPLEEEELAE